MGGCGIRGDGGVGAGEMGVWEQGRQEGLAAGEMGVWE